MKPLDNAGEILRRAWSVPLIVLAVVLSPLASLAAFGARFLVQTGGRIGAFTSDEGGAMRKRTVGALAFAITFIGQWQGLRSEAYREAVGGWTQCNGETRDAQSGHAAPKAECGWLANAESGCGVQCAGARMEPILEAAHERLDGVVFENLDWAEIVRRYDTPETLFYLDPPYFGNEKDYGREMFARGDFTKMASLLEGIKGAFVLSINDTKEIREVFSAFFVDEVRLTYAISHQGAAGKSAELIISNRKATAGLL